MSRPTNPPVGLIVSDEWISSFSTVAPATLHAIGAIVFEWNRCEAEMAILVLRLSRLDKDFFKVLIADANNTELPKKAEALCAIMPFVSLELSDYVAHICKCFDINRINRNTVVHSWPTWDIDDLEPGFQIARGHSFSHKTFQPGLEDLRRVCDDITLCRSRLAALNDAIVPVPHSALPDRLAPPRPLI